MNKEFHVRICTLFSLLLTAAITSQATPPGQLDTTFGTNGMVITQVTPNAVPSYVNGVAIQTDGKIVTVGFGLTATDNAFTVVRYNQNGSLDSTFNGTGISTAVVGTPNAVAIQTDGKIIVVGHNANPANLDFRVVRFNANGTLDAAFDGDGEVTTPIGDGYDVAYAVAIQTDGKIVVSGRSDSNPVFVTSFAIVRYNTNGSLDTTFDSDGIVITPGPGNAITDSLAIQTDGKIVIAHNLYSGSAYVLSVLRYNGDGSPDTTFDDDGIVSTTVGTNVEQASVAIQTNGKIVVAVSSYTSMAAGYDFYVVRYNADGALDAEFGNSGLVVTPIGAGAAFDQPKSIAIQANGKIVVGGKSTTGSNSDFAVVRYNRNGSLDAKWGNGGIVTTDLGGTAESANSIAIQSDGRIVAGGETDAQSPTVRRFATVRYIGDAGENFDYDKDGNSDISVYRPSDGTWYVLGSSSGSLFGVKWGASSDELAPADYDGDLKTDYAVWRGGAFAYLYILNSSNGTARIEQFGQTGDDPSIVGDYDGDGKADPAVYRPGAGAGQQSYFYYRGSLNNPGGNTSYVPWGTNGDVAARGDYNGDGRFDPTVFRPSSGVWYSLNLGNNTSTATPWGLSTDKLVPADYDGDGKTDRAVFRNGTWFVLQSTTGLAQYAYWGLSTDIPVPSDYDGDGRADAAVYRNGTWYIQQSSAGDRTIAFGLATDIPTPRAYMP